MALTPPPAAPQRGDRATFAQRVDAFITWLINFVAELNIFSANLNSIAAGGVYTLPFEFRTNGSDIGGLNGRLVMGGGGGTQASANSISFDSVDKTGVSIRSRLDDVFSSTSAAKGAVRLISSKDPSKWLTFRVLSWVYTPGGFPYGSLSVLPTGASSENPFAYGDDILMIADRTGDKGDAGIASCLKVSDRKSAVEGGAASVGWNTRTLNTVDANTITGASLASNTVTLPAGTFDVFGRAPATQNIHKAALYNVTDSVYALVGSNAQSSSSGASTDSIVVGRITLTSPKTFQLRHYVNSTSGSGTHFGFTSGSGQIDVYSELQFLKVA